MHAGWRVLIKGDRIVSVGAEVAAPAGAREIDLPNDTLLPGLIEGHSHLFLHPYNETSWDNQVQNALNGPFWKGQDWTHAPLRADLGAFMFSGWFDDDLTGTLSNWALMARIGTAPQRLMLGPWKHGANVDRALNGYSYGLDALRDDTWLLKQQWYDHFLKDVDNAVTKTRVEYFVLGDNEWRTATAWPPKEVEPQQWFFHSDGLANQRFTSGRLTLQVRLKNLPPNDPETSAPRAIMKCFSKEA